jgi:hypothetical protein
MRARRSQIQGISLIEALVALAVMSFGMLGVVGMQATMRQNADISKQRSEAVRLAQQSVEQGRAFSVLDEPLVPDPLVRSYSEIASSSASYDDNYATNTSFTVEREVVDPTAADANAPRLKALQVSVLWNDRAGVTQNVRLNTVITASAPDLAGSLGIPGSDPLKPQLNRRNVIIPVEASDRGNGKSVFSPPNASGLSWVFDNLSGVITSICNPSASCTSGAYFLVSGYVRFATASAQPTTADAENPTGAAIALDVQIQRTQPTNLAVDCYEQTFTSYVAYYCAVPASEDTVPKWSGLSLIVESSTLPLADTLIETAANQFRVCRYTSARGDTSPKGNTDHPLVYTDVTGVTPLRNQNFLIIRAGNGSAPYTCPADDESTPLLNGNTWHHQPNT